MFKRKSCVLQGTVTGNMNLIWGTETIFLSGSERTLYVHLYVPRDGILDLNGTVLRKSWRDKVMGYSSSLQLRAATGF
jgi:hypothetical protein